MSVPLGETSSPVNRRRRKAIRTPRTTPKVAPQSTVASRILARRRLANDPIVRALQFDTPSKALQKQHRPVILRESTHKKETSSSSSSSSSSQHPNNKNNNKEKETEKERRKKLVGRETTSHKNRPTSADEYETEGETETETDTESESELSTTSEGEGSGKENSDENEPKHTNKVPSHQSRKKGKKILANITRDLANMNLKKEKVEKKEKKVSSEPATSCSPSVGETSCASQDEVSSSSSSGGEDNSRRESAMGKAPKGEGSKAAVTEKFRLFPPGFGGFFSHKTPSISPTRRKSSSLSSTSSSQGKVKKQDMELLSESLPAANVVIVKSSRRYERYHKLDALLGNHDNYGGGCWVFKSTWRGHPTVTKLMPMFECNDFPKDENEENAFREVDIHTLAFRTAMTKYATPLRGSVKNGDERDSDNDVDISTDDDDDSKTERSKDMYKHNGSSAETHTCCVVPIWAASNVLYHKKEYLAVVMPRLQSNLTQYVWHNGVLSYADAWFLLHEGCKFLKVCIECEFIHHDIKSENIFITFKQHSLNKKQRLEQERSNGNASSSSSSGAGGGGGGVKEKKKAKKVNNKYHMTSVCFGDFGCSAWLHEEFPFNPITGTLTMWDSESLGEKYGQENGFCIENDLYGLIHTVFDACIGYNMIERHLFKMDPKWEDYEWKDYTNVIRNTRQTFFTAVSLKEALKNAQCFDADLVTVFKQLLLPRNQRMSLSALTRLVTANFEKTRLC